MVRPLLALDNLLLLPSELTWERVLGTEHPIRARAHCPETESSTRGHGAYHPDCKRPVLHVRVCMRSSPNTSSLLHGQITSSCLFLRVCSVYLITKTRACSLWSMISSWHQNQGCDLTSSSSFLLIFSSFCFWIFLPYLSVHLSGIKYIHTGTTITLIHVQSFPYLPKLKLCTQEATTPHSPFPNPSILCLY